MINNQSNSPGSSGVNSTPSGSSAGASSNTGGSTAGGGNFGGIPSAGASPLVKPRKGFRKEVTLLASGFGFSFPDGSSLSVNGQSMDKSSILAALQAALVLYGNLDAAVQQAKSSRVALEAALPVIHQFVVALKGGLVCIYGKGNPALEAYGFNLVKPRQLTVEQKTARKEKAKRTRALRGTGGKRQKQAVVFTGQIEVQAHVAGTEVAGGSLAGAQGSPAGSGNAGSGGTPSSGA